MQNKNSIATVVVTYNRAELLLNCLKSIVTQTLLPDELFIVDNCSTDNTQALLREQGYLGNTIPEHTAYGVVYRTCLNLSDYTLAVTYIHKKTNDGGAGGFATGMNCAFDRGYEWIWMMDDDGIADENELAELLEKSLRYDIVYANPLVININDPQFLSFGLNNSNQTSSFLNREIVWNDLNPFNGTFVKRDVIVKIGGIKKEMFIWGDELEYTCRVQKAGLQNGTICTAKHYHPASKANLVNILPLMPYRKMPVPAPERSGIFYRNRGYINKNYRPAKTLWGWLGIYTILFGVRFQWRELYKLYKYYFRGIRNDYRND